MEFRKTWIIALTFLACAMPLQAMPKRIATTGGDDSIVTGSGSSVVTGSSGSFVSGSGGSVATGSGDVVSDPPTTTLPYTIGPRSSTPSNEIECGKKDTTGRIYGGINAPLGAWPWHVSTTLCADCYNYCGGTIIGKKWVVTAAHCFANMSRHERENVYVKAGVVNEETGSKHQQTFRVAEMHMHENYNVAAPFDLDVAVLKLDKDIELNDYVGSLCLNEHELNEGQECAVTGFGETEESDYSNHLKQAIVPIVSREICTQTYGSDLTNNMICAGYTKGKIDSCSGDSGGPLSCYDAQSQRFVLGGIVSFGDGCAEAHNYGVYTHVKHVASWIKNVITPHAI